MRKWTSLLLVGLLAVAATATAGDRKAARDAARRSDSRIEKVAAVRPLPPNRSLALLEVPPAPAVDASWDGPPPGLTPVPEPGLPYGPMPYGPMPGGPGEYHVLPHEGGYPAVGAVPVATEGCPCELFACVDYEDLDHIHPCAVRQIVAVPDPCPSCDCAGPKCVYVAICVPPCECPKVKVKDKGREITYDYGDYKVEIESEDGKVSVDYDD